MSLETIHCAVLNGPVTRITDFEGATLRLVCPELVAASGQCRIRLRAADGGPLAQLLEHVADHDLRATGSACLMRT